MKLISYEDALKTLLEETETVEGSEGAMLDNALGRVAIADIASPIDVPSYRKSQMDGYAIVSSDSFKASEDSPVQLEVIEEIDAGDIPSK
ncbi:MAG TPA: molybdopterin molybdenumtransferase MoeA, partial [Candidatus Methanofastidiosa archaeon]|nr:molybdopterin molybdenumtransferase MoeA [Candidatus Methanofastidiosa archaeon]